jgi:catechol 2,3-dioxygenase-like lactoylglutathione lyase family enzyme
LNRGVLALAGALLLASGAGAVRGQSGGAPVARFHHVHYKVPDPAAAMADAVRATEGVRTIVQGVGVGVRAGREFVLFDRLDVEQRTGTAPSAAESYPVALALLRRAGFAVEPSAANASRAVNALAHLPLDHLGFAVDDPAAAAVRLEAGGGRVLSQREDAVLFVFDEGLRLEILRDTEREELFWCPMHPDVRSPDAGKCPLCAMDLVAIPPPRIGEYGLDVSVQRNPRDGIVRALRFRVREPVTNAEVGGLQVVHERAFHLFIISRDLEFFDHVHPERQADGSYELRQTLPADEYMLIADFLPVGGTSQMVQRAVISGKGARATDPRFPAATPRVVSRDGLTVTLDAEPARAGREVLLTFSLTDQQSGQPVTDLEPYLGAPAHMLIVRGDLSDAVHAHPEEAVTGGPTVSFHPLLPAEGDYKLWIQVQRRGKVITVPFVLRTER